MSRAILRAIDSQHVMISLIARDLPVPSSRFYQAISRSRSRFPPGFTNTHIKACVQAEKHALNCYVARYWSSVYLELASGRRIGIYNANSYLSINCILAIAKTKIIMELAIAKIKIVFLFLFVVNAKETLRIGMLISQEGDFDFTGFIPAMNLALETIENDTTLPFNFYVRLNDSKVNFYLVLYLDLYSYTIAEL